jgi:hypothetical protein
MPSKNSGVRKHGASHRFLFPKSVVGASAEALAERLIEIDGIEEVLLSESGKDYIVNVRFFDGKNRDFAIEYMQRKLGGRFG